MAASVFILVLDVYSLHRYNIVIQNSTHCCHFSTLYRVGGYVQNELFLYAGFPDSVVVEGLGQSHRYWILACYTLLLGLIFMLHSVGNGCCQILIFFMLHPEDSGF